MMEKGSFHFQKKLKEESLCAAQFFSEPCSSLSLMKWNVFAHMEEQIQQQSQLLYILPTIYPRMNACCSLFFAMLLTTDDPRSRKIVS